MAGMSDALALVRFPDGALRVAYFLGDAGLVVPLLFPIEDAPNVWEAGAGPLLDQLASHEEPPEPEPAETETVQIWTSYGTPSWWEGQASHDGERLVAGIDPYGVADDFDEGPPSRPTHVHEGTPSWVPDDWRPQEQ
jgi:hypothetical protein